MNEPGSELFVLLPADEAGNVKLPPRHTPPADRGGDAIWDRFALKLRGESTISLGVVFSGKVTPALPVAG